MARGRTGGFRLTSYFSALFSACRRGYPHFFPGGYEREMSQEVVRDQARRFGRMDPRLHRQAREGGVSFGDRMQTHARLNRGQPK